MSTLSRRTALTTGALAMLGACAPATSRPESGGGRSVGGLLGADEPARVSVGGERAWIDPADTGGDTGDTGLAADGACEDRGDLPEDCSTPTSYDDEGPNYVEHAHERTNLNVTDAPGDLLIVTGRILGRDCRPIPNCALDVWHVDPSLDGYDFSEAGNCRGLVFADDNGTYCFRTLVPPQVQGRTLRPAHLHFIVLIGGQRALTTQVYREGDSSPEMPDKKPDLVLPFEKLDEGLYLLRRNFVLDHIAP